MISVVSSIQRFHCTGLFTTYDPSGVLYTEVSLYRTVYYDPSGVLYTEVSLYYTIQ